jgi:hypothetical protein
LLAGGELEAGDWMTRPDLSDEASTAGEKLLGASPFVAEPLDASASTDGDWPD